MALRTQQEEMDGETVESVKYKKSKWYFHNGSVPHEVIDIPMQRVAVTIFEFKENKAGNLYNAPPPKIVKAFRNNPYFYYI